MKKYLPAHQRRKLAGIDKNGWPIPEPPHPPHIVTIPSTRCLFPFLPIEIIDRILDFYFLPSSPNDINSSYHYRARPGVALVCRSWRRPAQRRLLRRICLSHWNVSYKTPEIIFEDITAVMSSTVLGEFVHSVRVTLLFGSWTAAQLAVLLRAFPNLTNLILNLTRGSPGDRGNYSALEKLPRLKRLEISNQLYDPEMLSFRQIAAVTPNITTLQLKFQSLPFSLPPRNMMKFMPVDLPHLTRLEFPCHALRLATNIADANLFTDATFRRLDDLNLVLNDSNAEHSNDWPESLLALTTNLKSLTLYQSCDEVLQAIMDASPTVETLIIDRECRGLVVPPSLTTLRYRLSVETWVGTHDARDLLANWDGIKRLFLDGYSLSGWVYDVWKGAKFPEGVEIYIGGERYIRSGSKN